MDCREIVDFPSPRTREIFIGRDLLKNDSHKSQRHKTHRGLRQTSEESLKMEATPQQEIKGCTFTKDITLEAIRQSHRDFCTRRDWDQYHTPRNLILALVGEIGELSESTFGVLHTSTRPTRLHPLTHAYTRYTFTLFSCFFLN